MKSIMHTFYHEKDKKFSPGGDCMITYVELMETPLSTKSTPVKVTKNWSRRSLAVCS